MPRMSEEVPKCKFLEVGSKIDTDFDPVKVSQKQETYSFRDGDCDRSYKRFDARDHLHYDQRLSVFSNGPLNENYDGSYEGFDARRPRLSLYAPLIETRYGGYQLHEDYMYPRLISMTEQDRGRDNIWRKSSAHFYDEQVGSSQETDYNCRDCGSRRCSRGRECSQLRQNVYRCNYSPLDDVCLNDFQLDIGQLENRRRYRNVDSDRKWAIDKGHDDYQQRSSDLDCSTDFMNMPPRRKRIGPCQKFLHGQCWRGTSCWDVHDVAGRYHHGRGPYMLAEFHGRLLSTENSPAKDDYLYSDILNSHTSKLRYKRCIPSDADADYLFKKRRTESWRHEDGGYSEEGGTTNRKVSQGGRGQFYKEHSWEARRGYETITADSFVCKSSDESPDTAESNDINKKRRERFDRDESICCSESLGSRSETSDMNLNGCRISRKRTYQSDKQLSGKHSREGRYHRVTPLKKRSSSSIMKRGSLNRNADYHPMHKNLRPKNGGSLLCKYYMKGYCQRGNRCWFNHEVESTKNHVDLDEKKRSDSKRMSVVTNDTPPSQHLSSTNNSKRSPQKKDPNSAKHSNTITRRAEVFFANKCLPETDKKDLRPDKGRKVSGSQESALYRDCKNCSEIYTAKKTAPEHDIQKECVDSEKKTCGNQDDKDDAACANYLMGCSDGKKSPVQQMVERHKSAADPSLPSLQNLASEISSVNLDSCVKVGQPEEILKVRHIADQTNLTSAIVMQHVGMVCESEARRADNYGTDKCRKVKSSGKHSNSTTRRAKTFPAKKCMPGTDKKDRCPDKRKKVSCSQEGALYRDCSVISAGKQIAPGHDMQRECGEREKKTYGDQEGNGDDGCVNFRMGLNDVKNFSVQQMVNGKNLAGYPSLLNLQNSVSVMSNVNLNLHVELVREEETLKDIHIADQSNLPSAILKQHVSMVSGSEVNLNSQSLSSGSEVNLNSQSLSSGPEVNAAQKGTVSVGLEECANIRRVLPDTSVEMPLEHQSELQESLASMVEQGNGVTNDQSVSALLTKRPSLCHTDTAICGVSGCYEKVAEKETCQENRVRDVYVGDDCICGIQEQEGNNGKINNRSITTSYGVNHSEATMASMIQVGEEMLACETIPITSTANYAASFQMPAIEDASFDDIGHHMCLDHYIYTNLSLEHYLSHESHMEDDSKANATHCTYEEQSSFLEDPSIAMTSENLIQQSNVYSLLPACDDISETKPIRSSSTFCTDLSPPPTRIISKEVDEIIRGPNPEWHENNISSVREKKPAVKLEPVNVRIGYTEETTLHVSKEPGSSLRESHATLDAESTDKHFEQLSMGQTSERKPVFSSYTSGRGSDFKTNISAGPPGPRSKQYESFTSEKNKELLVVNTAEPAATLVAKEKLSSVVDFHLEAQKSSRNVSCKHEEGMIDEDEKLLLRLAVLELAKEILDPLWKAGRINSKEIYKSITGKVVDKVCASVHGVNIPRTKENVDCYLLRCKPKIAQLVLAYVSMYPVQL